jgi:hypothetical protein
MYNDSAHEYQADVQLICEKLGIGRHAFIMLTTKLCRLTSLSPKQMIDKLGEIDDLEAYIFQLRIEQEELAYAVKSYADEF